MIKAAVPVLLALTIAPAATAAVPEIHAHRGGTVQNGTARFGEESLSAYMEAARNGFVLEVDAKLTEDRVPVAIHDATLDRTTTCSGEVRTFTLAELRPCRIDSPHGSAPVITIKRLLRFARTTGTKVNLEIKNVPTDPDFDSTPAYANRVMDAVLASRIPRRQLIIQSFIASNLDVARQRLPGVTTSLLALRAINEAYLRTAADNDYDFISPEWPVSADYVRRAHGRGLDVAPFTINTPADVRAASGAGVDALITDDPLMAALELGRRPLPRLVAGANIRVRRLRAGGTLELPTGVGRRDGCRGTVTVRIIRAGRVLRTRRVRVGRGCRFQVSMRRPGPPEARLLATIRFNGNDVLLPSLVGPRRVGVLPIG